MRIVNETFLFALTDDDDFVNPGGGGRFFHLRHRDKIQELQNGNLPYLEEDSKLE
jgi:hypothetical protein